MKKGFTLIELLAVILILGIIALIAVPQVTNVIEKSRKGAAETSAEHYISAVNTKIGLNQLDTDSTNDIKDGILDASTLEVDVTGEKPTSGAILIKNGNIQTANLALNGYTIDCNSKGKCTASKGLFKYYSELGVLSTSSTTLDTRPLDKIVYLKYSTLDTELSNIYYCGYDDGEVCFRYTDYEDVEKQIIDYFEYDKNTWEFINSSWYKKGTNQTVGCRVVKSSQAKCWNEKIVVSANSINNSKYLSVTDASNNYACKMNNDKSQCTDVN
jgi:type IV pilus assembly protein PilA